MENGNSLSLKVIQNFNAPVEKVFDAFLTPDLAGKFMFATDAGTMTKVEIDPKVGGHFNFTERRDGIEFAHVGRYIEIDRPSRLVFDFRVEGYGDKPARVVLEFRSIGAVSEVVLSQNLAPEWAEHLEKTKKGWVTILERATHTLWALNS